METYWGYVFLGAYFVFLNGSFFALYKMLRDKTNVYPLLVVGNILFVVFLVMYMTITPKSEHISELHDNIEEILGVEVSLNSTPSDYENSWGEDSRGNYKFISDDILYDVEVDKWKVLNISTGGKIIYSSKLDK